MDYEVLVRQCFIQEKMIEEMKQDLARFKREILDTPEARQQYQPLSNSGGQHTDKSVGVTFEVKRKHTWDQDVLHSLWYQQPDENLPPHLTRQIVYKVDMKKFKEWAIANPSEAARMSAALSTELGDPSIKSIKLKEEDNESISTSN